MCLKGTAAYARYIFCCGHMELLHGAIAFTAARVCVCVCSSSDTVSLSLSRARTHTRGLNTLTLGAFDSVAATAHLVHLDIYHIAMNVCETHSFIHLA